MSSLLLSLLLVLIPRLDAGSQCKVCESLIMKNGASDETFRIILPVETACADAPVIECSEWELCFFANRDLRLVYSDGQRATEEASRIDLICLNNAYLDFATCEILYEPEYPSNWGTFQVTMNQCEVKIDGDIPPTALGLPESDSGSDQTDSGDDQTDSGDDQTGSDRVVGALRCHQSDNAADAQAPTYYASCSVYDPVPTMCFGPQFIEYTGLAYGGYGCGRCTREARDAGTCKDCSGDGCNVPITETRTFECTEYIFDPQFKAFTRAAVTTCHASKYTKAICNRNGPEAWMDYVVMNAGCGPCVAMDYAAKTCVDCDGNRCTDDAADNCDAGYNLNCYSAATAAAITAFLLPMIALFYSLF